MPKADNLPPSWAVVTKSGKLSFLEPSGPAQACNGTTLPFYDSNHAGCGLGSSVGIATDCGLDGPGSNPGVDEIFRPSRPALRPSQPPVQWVSGLSRG